MRFARIFAISFAIVMLLLVLLATTRIYAASTPHGCAPQAPPSLPGSPGLPPATPGIVLINEVLNNPASTWNCSEPSGTFALMTDSWVELYNPQSQPFNLYAAHTSLDSGPNTFTFHFPFGAAIAAFGYLVVFPDTYSGMLTAGVNLRLTIGGAPIDQVSVPALAADTSYARIPDGSRNWQITTKPTIDASNMASSSSSSTPVTTTRSASQGTGNGYTTPTSVDGKQPGWVKLQLPATAAVETPVTTSPLVASPPVSPINNAWEVMRRVLLTVLVVALAFSLFWCWRLIRAPFP